MVPLAWAFRLAGHEVTFAAAGDALAVRDAGFLTLDAVPGLTTARMIADFKEGPAAERLQQPREGISPEELEQIKPLVVAMWDGYVDGHVRLAERLRPDLIVYDPIFTAGPVAAAKLGVPCVAHSYGVGGFEPEVFDQAPANEAFLRHGVTVPKGVETIGVVPSSLEIGPRPRWSMRYTPYNGGGLLPEWLLDEGDRPRVAVTLGTVVPETHGLGEFAPIIEAAEAVDAEFVIATGSGETSWSTPLPPNVRVTGWVPLGALLRGSAAAIHHGGAGTTLTCSALGVPQLILPNGADRHINAETLAARGSALTTLIGDLEVPLIERLLTDEALRATAHEVRAEIEALPTPAEIAAELAALYTPDALRPAVA
ncbi:nucleotide disphospho-sugar-binding domain-containing protein [Streptosporangium sp. NPDC020072]|uniref:nucleotide disphospho-sugar-binding domain-containing protein n=1 Tax=Streptosporangium sp. NPDC020072 TaxID=3154788 RepID=UPI0034427343